MTPLRKKITEKLFSEWKNLNAEMYISELVIDEIDRPPEPKRTQLYDLLKEFSPNLLYIDDETIELSEKYVAEGIIPRKYENDAKHIVKLKTRTKVNGLNKLLGYKKIEISTPEEVL